MSRVVLLLAHAVEEAMQVRLLHELGHEVFSIGAYVNPAEPSVDIRPPLPQVPYLADLDEACRRKREQYAGQSTRIMFADGERDIVDWAKYDIPDEVLDWADILVVHHFEHSWLVPQWDRLRASGKRIIWRTVGQSVENNERTMAPLFQQGLEIVRYSPKERNIPQYAGESALIRFWVDPAEFGPWTGDIPAVINITQHLAQRDPYTNYRFWRAATVGLPAIPMGPGSEEIGGTGSLTYPKMLEMLRRARVYLYCGTQPASYTLGLIEAMMTGVPIVSIGPKWMDVFPYGPDLFEGHELVFPNVKGGAGTDDPAEANRLLRFYLDHPNHQGSMLIRHHAIELFGKETIAAQWAEYLR